MKKILTVTLFILFFISSFSFTLAKKQQKEEEINVDFFRKFQDEILLENILSAYSNNLDLKIAYSKVKESERIVKMSLASELPQVDFAPLISKTFSSGDLIRGKNNYMVRSYNQSRFYLPVYVSYDIDVWGKNRLKTKSKEQSLKMIEQDKKTSEILLSSSIAIDYYNLIKIDKLLELNQELLKLNKNALLLSKNKQKFGLLSEDDILSQKENLIKVQKTINNLENQKEILKNQIGYLTADKLFSDVKRKSFEDIEELFDTPNTLESNIILNRPDVKSAQENIKRASYDARVAKRELLPTFTIMGTFGFNGYNNLKGIFKNHTGLADISIMPNWNIFDAGKRFQLIKLKKLEYERAQKEYEQAVLASLQEVNDTLATLKADKKDYSLSKDIFEIQNKKLKLKSSNKAFGLSNELDYILYQEAQNLSAQSVVDNKINQIISAINLYRATGGVDFTKENL